MVFDTGHGKKEGGGFRSDDGEGGSSGFIGLSGYTRPEGRMTTMIMVAMLGTPVGIMAVIVLGLGLMVWMLWHNFGKMDV